MKKKITALLCAICMMCSLFPLTAHAIPQGKLEGVDYDRIHYAGYGHDVKFTLGNLNFQGRLERGSNLSADEIDQIIRKVQTDMKITSGMLINAERLIKEAENIEGFGLNDVLNALGDLTGTSALIDLYNLTMGSSKDPVEAAMDIASGAAVTIAEDVAEHAIETGGKIALTTAGKFAFKLFFLLPDLTKIGLDAWVKYDTIRATVARGLEKQLMLDGFYQKCNDDIKEAGGEGEWLIRFDNAKARHSFFMWGIPTLLSEWKLSGELVRQVTGAGEAFGGTYKGLLTLEISGIEMDVRFDKNFKDSEIFFNGGGNYLKGEKELWGNQGITLSTVKDNFKATTLKRTVSGEFTVYVMEGSGEITPTVLGSLTSGSDKTEFSFDHHINGSGKRLGVEVNGSIKYTSNDINSYNYVSTKTAAGITLDDDTTSGNIKMNVGSVWKPLESEPKLTIHIK